MNLEGYEIEDDGKCDQSKWIALLDAEVQTMKQRIDDITGAELDAYKVTGDRLDLLEQKVGLLLTHLGLEVDTDETSEN